MESVHSGGPQMLFLRYMRTLGFYLLYFVTTLSFSNFPQSLYASNNFPAPTELLKEFHQDPQKFMNTLPLKMRDHLSNEEAISSEKEITSSALWKERNFWRSWIMNNGIGNGNGAGTAGYGNHKSAIMGNDRAEEFVTHEGLITSLQEMEKQNLLTGKSDMDAWSDNYWPIYKGILGSRYANEEFLDLSEWQDSYNFVQKNKAEDLFAAPLAQQRDQLSPAEKYDLLMGNKQWTLTKQMWAEGKYYHDAHHGEVERWMGICHGWAPASFMLRRPLKKIQVMSFDGKTQLTFFPSDIKALASLLWAKAQTPTRFIGGRCNNKSPQYDENGRILSQECFDSNPASWHLSIVNELGQGKRSFIMDTTFDYEVWNQPVLSYEYSYFEPETNKETHKLQEAIIPVSAYKSDKFKKYRSPLAKSIVGIAMEVTYLVETGPSHQDMDGPEEDSRHTVYYLYDLELDANGKIIGGEWYNNAHPDFLWTPGPDARALASEDYLILSEPLWTTQTALPTKWQEFGRKAAARGIPLARIVESLIQRAQN